jgi:trehalose 6-phosphate synthase/phosphatase
MDRLLIVSNRLPVGVRVLGGKVSLVASSGGLATGLRDYHERSSGQWIGWPGDESRLSPGQRRESRQAMVARRLIPLRLSPQEMRGYYEGFSNGILWPVFHHLLDRIPLDSRDWRTYREVNEKFAVAVAKQYRPGDLIWVHDYQLALVPALLRERLPESRIGFFLHIPFPAHEVFRVLPWRQELLKGMLGSSLVGFHAESYVRHFATAVRAILGLSLDAGVVAYLNRHVRIGAFPMGIDAASFGQLAADSGVLAEAESVRRRSAGRAIILGVDRLDYTKGIPRRLLAFRRLLEQEPRLRDRVRLIQVAVPSRDTAEPYRVFRKELDELVGRINGAVSTLDSTPVHYLYRSISRAQLVALYLAADVMLVTPLRDGMNLVSKEFVASRVDEDGVLVLSEFAGSAEHLTEAVIVNPYDIDGVVAALKRALSMPKGERTRRMRALREHVLARDVHVWAGTFIDVLSEPVVDDVKASAALPRAMRAPIAGLRRADRRLLLLDYDGTLVPLKPTPGEASPTADVLRLLAAIGADPGSRVHIISGRPREELERWFGHLPDGLWAEHGLWGRAGPEAEWTTTADVSLDWMPPVRAILERVAKDTPGALVEVKTASLAWHFRKVEPWLAARRLRGLRERLAIEIRGLPVETIDGSKVLEIRNLGVNKGLAVRRILELDARAPGILAVGDDLTDEDMFAALPKPAVRVHVGTRRTRAEYRLADPAAVHLLLDRLRAGPGEDGSDRNSDRGRRVAGLSRKLAM